MGDTDEPVLDVAHGPCDFEEWYRAAWPRLVAAVALDTRDLGTAEDAVAEAMVAAMARWRDGTIRSPDAWVYRVAVRHGRRVWFRRRREGGVVVGHDHCDAQIEADPDLWRAVASLPQRQRHAVVLRYVLDLTQQAVADEMGVAPGTVAALLHQARSRLKKMMGAQP